MRLLRWFYVIVQFVMLAVSIPKVATLFHAYNPNPIGPSFAGVDITSWAVGIVIDCCAAVTTMAAMAKFEASRSRSALTAPAIIVLCCTTLSVIANYEDAATLAPLQYAHVSLFTHPALLINPFLISSPPLLVFLLITLVPSVLAQPRIKSAEEIEASTAEQEALIAASNRLDLARADAKQKLREKRLGNMADTVGVLGKRMGIQVAAAAPEETPTDEPPDDDPDPEPPDDGGPASDRRLERLEVPSPAKMSSAMWNAMPLPERVAQSGVIVAKEVAEVLGVSQSYARDLVREARALDDDPQTPSGRKGVTPSALIQALYDRKTATSLKQAKTLESALRQRKRSRQADVLRLLPAPEVPEEAVEL
jgi:hypothetical protein